MSRSMSSLSAFRRSPSPSFDFDVVSGGGPAPSAPSCPLVPPAAPPEARSCGEEALPSPAAVPAQR